MALELKSASRIVKGQVFIQPTDLVLEKGTMNVLLGPTLSGKTSLMRLMAGLDVPNTGRVFWNGKDVTGMRVQDRKVAMVYQQFINYPSMSVYDNIASPLRLMGKTKAEIDAAEGRPRPMISIERFAFYDVARKAYAVIQTGERRFYGCFMLRKGVIGPEE